MSVTLALSLVLAWPVDMVQDVEPGKEKFVKLGAVEWAESEDPAIATAEVMETHEVLITGLKPGRTLVLLYAEGRFAVWRVRVGAARATATTVGREASREEVKAGVAVARPPAQPEEPPLEPAKKACPDLKHTPKDDPKLTVTVATEACGKALLQLFMGDAFTARELELTFDGKVLQAQLKTIQAELKKGVASKYVGAGLVLEGEVTPAEHRQILWSLFKKSVGRVALDDRLETRPPQ